MRRCCLIAIELKSRSSHGLLKALMSCKAECTNRLSTMAACALLHGACCMNNTRVQLCFKACLTELECCSPVCCCWGAGDVVHLLHVISDPRSSSTPGERAEHSAANHLCVVSSASCHAHENPLVRLVPCWDQSSQCQLPVQGMSYAD